jgi:hypothetical protein
MVSHIKMTSDISGDNKPGDARSQFLDRPERLRKSASLLEFLIRRPKMKRGTKSEKDNIYQNHKVANETSEIAVEPFMEATETPSVPSLVPPDNPLSMTLLEESTQLFSGEPLAPTELGPDSMGYNPSAIATAIIPSQFLTPYPTNVPQSHLFGDHYSQPQSFHPQLDNPAYFHWNTQPSHVHQLDHRYSTVRPLENQAFSEDYYLEDCARNPGEGDQ